jgi:Family of unknown function (DUF5343)
MSDFVYTVVPGKLRQLLNKIRTVGVPRKVNADWLKTLGFTSSNDKSLIGVLKFIGMIDPSGVPTSAWSALRGADYKKVLGAAVRQGYADLFAVYPDANKRTNSELEHVFSTSSSGGKQVIGKTVQTFKALVAEAEFPEASETDLHVETGPLHTAAVPRAAAQTNTPANSFGPTLHIDIQIHISSEASAEQIDRIFESMAKHIYGPKSKVASQGG